jgi:hypothetical protein
VSRDPSDMEHNVISISHDSKVFGRHSWT